MFLSIHFHVRVYSLSRSCVFTFRVVSTHIQGRVYSHSHTRACIFAARTQRLNRGEYALCLFHTGGVNRSKNKDEFKRTNYTCKPGGERRRPPCPMALGVLEQEEEEREVEQKEDQEEE